MSVTREDGGRRMPLPRSPDPVVRPVVASAAPPPPCLLIGGSLLVLRCLRCRAVGIS